MKLRSGLLLLLAVLCGLIMQQKAQAQVYGVTVLQYDPSSHTLSGYSATDIEDPYIGYYYDPYVEGYLYDGNGNLLSAGSGQGYGDYAPAEAYTSANGAPRSSYTLVSDHYLIGYFTYYDDYGYTYYYDPYGYGFLEGGNYGGNWYFAPGPGSEYVSYEYIYLGSTGVNLQTPDPTPRVTGISPSDWVPGSDVTVTISGTGFGTNPSVQVDGYGIYVTVLSAGDTQIVANFSIAPDADPNGHNVTVTSNGYGGNGFFAGNGGGSVSPNSNSANFSVTYPDDVKSSNQVNLSTGDPASAHHLKVIFGQPPGLPPARVTLDFDSQLQSNLGGTANATLTLPSVTSTSPADITIKAGPDGSANSGEFYVRAKIRKGPVGLYGLRAVVPPQIILQMMRNEARAFGSNPLVQTYLAWAFKNRLGDRTYFGSLQTYDANIKKDATYDPTVTRGEQPELDRAAAVFVDPYSSDPTGSSQGFWSPTNNQWAQIQPLISSGTTQMPDKSVTGISFFYNGDRSITQIVYFPSVPRNNRPDYDQAPAFLFVRKRSAGDPAAVQMGQAAFNRIDESPVFVQQQYVDFLNRQPEQDGWVAWTDVLTACGSDAACLASARVQVSKGFFFSQEFIGNDPTLAGSNQGTPSYNREFVRQCYLGFLRREPDQGGWDAWTADLNDPGPDQNNYDHIISAFLNSDEYRGRFVYP